MKLILKKILLITFFINYFSCTSNLDFEQVEVIETTPIYNVSLGFFNITSNGFSGPDNIPVTSVSSDIEYRIFENTLLRDNLKKQEYAIEITNLFNRAFEIEISFLDFDGNNTFSSFTYTVNANDRDFKEKIIIDDIDTRNSNVKNTTTLRLKISLEDESIPLNEANSGSFNFKSSTTLYLGTSINHQN